MAFNRKSPKSKPEEKEKEKEKIVNPSIEPKQAVIKPENLSSKTPMPRKLKIQGFKGSYLSVHFDNDGVSNIPVPEHIEAELRAKYGDLVKEIQD